MKNPEVKFQNGNQETIAKKYLSLSETCEYLSLSKACIYSWTSKKKNLPFFKIGKKLLFKVSDIDEFVENHRIKPLHEIESEAISHIIRGK